MSKSELGSISELVPQISSDIIGRIIPGVIVVFSLLIAVVGPTQASGYIDAWIVHPSSPISGWAIVLLIVAGYVAGVILVGIWHVPALFHRPFHQGYKPDPDNPSDSLRFDMVRVKSSKAGARNTKLSAEMSQARVLIVGWAACAAINLYFLVTAFSLERLWLEIALAISVAGAVSFRRHIHGLLQLSLANHWLILRGERLPKEYREE
jgi:hypothetical protein